MFRDLPFFPPLDVLRVLFRGGTGEMLDVLRVFFRGGIGELEAPLQAGQAALADLGLPHLLQYAL